MKIAVSAEDKHLDAAMDPRFGRAACFVFVDSETLKSEGMPNPNVQAIGGAGIQSAQLILDKGAKIVITGHCGPNAYRVLNSAGVKIFEGNSGTVKEVIQMWRNGSLRESEESAGGRGKGRKHFSGESITGGNNPASKFSPEDETKQVRKEIEKMEKRLKELNDRLAQIKKNTK
ncbi:MAG: dinitrogenase iron-molybdenum cofactor biosynthesis protein [Calditrichaeota bacterium]|nr:NifB/NifX family molybdenum-iron cluster-binding protein [Calditrichota bacterium]RQW04930.1 MAG: dinitrogenase iron-molybdenum cofactor biosynthesis protein [Calditrichota bacterium]